MKKYFFVLKSFIVIGIIKIIKKKYFYVSNLIIEFSKFK